MRLSKRAYPYPVVGNQDDVPGAAFQAAIEAKNDRVNLVIAVQISNSSKTLLARLKKGKCKYVMHLECSSTLFRKAFDFDQAAFELKLPVEHVNGTVELIVFCISTADDSGYQLDQANEDYGDAAFSIRKGDVLAVSEAFSFDVDVDYDSLKSISSFIEVKPAIGPADEPMKLELECEKIRVFLNENEFQDYQKLRTPSATDGLLAFIVLPALMEGIQAIKAKDGLDDYRWCRCLKRRMAEEGYNEDTNAMSFDIAMKILANPVRRGIVSLKSMLVSEGADE